MQNLCEWSSAIYSVCLSVRLSVSLVNSYLLVWCMFSVSVPMGLEETIVTVNKSQITVESPNGN